MAPSPPCRLSPWLACSLALACGGGRGPHNDGDGPTPGSSSAGVILPDAPTTGDTDEDRPRLDLPGHDTDGDGQVAPKGCEKVDFLFVIDNSNSMADEQSSLVASFPGFIATIQQTLSAQDYHIMAISTDKGEATGGGEDCDDENCTCAPAPNCCRDVCDWPFNSTCNGVACDDLVIDACEFKYGSGRLYNKDGVRCDIEGGRRYMLASQPNLEDTFACAATIGALGSGDEKPILAAQAAVGAKQNQPGGCNEGFLRDDAILVLVIITDEEDDNVNGGGSFGEPADWYASIVEAKLGVPSAAVVLGLVGDGNLASGACPLEWDPDQDGGEPAPRLQEFVGMFENGIVGSVCTPDYTPFFLEAVSVIDTACDLFEPVK